MTSNDFFLFITLIYIGVSDVGVSNRNETRLSNNRSFNVASNISNNLFKRRRISEMDISRGFFSSSFTFIVIESVEEAYFVHTGFSMNILISSIFTSLNKKLSSGYSNRIIREKSILLEGSINMNSAMREDEMYMRVPV